MPEQILPIKALNPVTLDRVVNRKDIPSTFLIDMLFPKRTHRVLPTETVQIDETVKGLQLAPFSSVNGRPITLTEGSQSAYTVTTPCISLDTQLSTTQEFMARLAGETDLILKINQDSKIREHVNQKASDDLMLLNETIDNTREWMASQLLTGEIAYSSTKENRVDFKLTTAKPAENTILTTGEEGWDITTAGEALTGDDYREYLRQKAANVTLMFDQVKRMAVKNQGPTPTDVILGEEAATAFNILKAQGAFDKQLETIKDSNSFTFKSTMNQSGVIWLGRLSGIDIWEYSHTLTDEEGTVHNMIRSTYAEFVTRARPDMRRMYFGMINDLYAIENNLHMTKRYFRTISHLKEHPSWIQQIVISRPLPVFLRPDWYFSAEVIAQ